MRTFVLCVLVALVASQEHGEMAPASPDAATTAPVPIVDTQSPDAVTDAPSQPPVVTEGPAPTAAANTTDAPTAAPTKAPTDAPTDGPTAAPTEAPTDAPTTRAPVPADFYPDVNEVINVFKGISESQYFQKLSYEDKLFVLEIIAGGESAKVYEVMDNQGYERIFNFLRDMPFKYADNLLQYILASINREDNVNAAMSS